MRRDEQREGEDERREGDERVHVGCPREEHLGRRSGCVGARFMLGARLVAVRHLRNEGD